MTLLASVTEQQYSTPELAGLPEGWWRLLGLLLLIGLGYVVFWLYRREARVGAPLRLRIWLGCLRGSVILLLALVWLEPVIARYTVRTITASVVVLTDVSASMSIVDAGDADVRATRIERVARMLEADEHAWLKCLAEQNDLSTYAFGERTTCRSLPWGTSVTATQPAAEMEPVAAEDRAPLVALQDHTDLGQALSVVLADVGESPVAGIVVISDGIFNRGMSASDAAA